MKIVAVIVTYNALEWLDKCIQSLINSSVAIDIVVVDNQSSDGTTEVLKEKYLNVTLIESSENLGFGRANNLGFEKAIELNADYILLLNQDAWVDENTIEELIDTFRLDQGIGISVPIQLNGNGNLLDELFQIYTINPCRPLITDLSLNRERKQYYEVSFANAACWLMSRSTIEKVGGFDPLYPHYREDDDYINRMKIHDLKIVLNPSVFCYHDRDGRKPITDFSKMINYAYVGYLLELKKMDTPIYSKNYFIKKMILNKGMELFGINKKYYKSNYLALVKILKNYNKIILNINRERHESFLYLK